MAQRLSFDWDDDWADGELWRASSPGDFKDDEAQDFRLFLIRKARDRNLWANVTIEESGESVVWSMNADRPTWVSQ